MRYQSTALACVLSALVPATMTLAEDAPALQDYALPGQLDPLPAGAASLYRTPWRSNPRTVAAHDAAQGIGVYYKHIPHDWTLEDHTRVMKVMAEAGVKRMRLAPHFAIYLTKDWAGPKEQELEALREELQACKAAGIRPCVVFVHIPPVGKPGTTELQDWWRQGELMPAGEVGSPEFQAFQDKTYQALRVVVEEARSAGFTDENSYDIEMGQGLWWGAPAVPRPMPGTDLSSLKPGGRIYEFDLGLIRRLRADGFKEPALWWAQTYHHFEHMTDEEVPAEAAGRTISFYSAWTGRTSDWMGTGMFDGQRKGPNDVWPARDPLSWLEGPAPEMVLARPEGWMADRSRRDNLIEAINASKTPIAITSLGTVPSDIPDASAGGLDGWTLKSRGLTRSLAFWLNQGSPFVLLHSAYEPGSANGGELVHSLIPAIADIKAFAVEQAPPLVTLKAFSGVLAEGKPVASVTDLNFQFALADNPELIPGSGDAKAATAADLVALLPFQLDEKRYAVAAYIVTPNLAQPLPPTTMTLRIDRRLAGTNPTATHPSTQAAVPVTVADRGESSTVLTFEVRDDVTWLVFDVE